MRYYENKTNLWRNQIVALGMAAVGIVLLVVLLRWPANPAQADADARR